MLPTNRETDKLTNKQTYKCKRVYAVRNHAFSRCYKALIRFMMQTNIWFTETDITAFTFILHHCP